MDIPDISTVKIRLAFMHMMLICDLRHAIVLIDRIVLHHTSVLLDLLLLLHHLILHDEILCDLLVLSESKLPAGEAFTVLGSLHIVQTFLVSRRLVCSIRFEALRIRVCIDVVLVIESWLRVPRMLFVSHLADDLKVIFSLSVADLDVGTSILFFSRGSKTHNLVTCLAKGVFGVFC